MAPHPKPYTLNPEPGTGGVDGGGGSRKATPGRVAVFPKKGSKHQSGFRIQGLGFRRSVGSNMTAPPKKLGDPKSMQEASHDLETMADSKYVILCVLCCYMDLLGLEKVRPFLSVHLYQAVLNVPYCFGDPPRDHNIENYTHGCRLLRRRPGTFFVYHMGGRGWT